jgi:putative ABC transport system permease protein
MFKNYLKVSLRHLTREPVYAGLNILGLTIGIVSSLLIILYLFNEVSYDKHHEKHSRIYRISSDIAETDNAFRWSVTQTPLAPTLKTEFAEVEQYVRFIPSGRTRLELDNISYYETNTYFVDSTVFDVFSFNFTAGDPANSLDEPNTIVLSQTVADKIFKGENPIGKVLKSDNFPTFKVTGVYEDMPTNSHIRATAMISASTLPNQNNNWGSFGIYSYVLLYEGADLKAFEAKLPGIIEKYVAVIFDQFDIKVKYEALNIADIHLYSTFQGEPEPLGNINYIYIFSAVALFLILIACINYMNLATARSTRRALEVGIRKTMGAQRESLIGQFLAESLLIAFIAMAISFILIILLVPAINAMLDINLSTANLLDTRIISLMVIVLFVTGILSGSYPAFYLSAFKPVAVLKGGASGRSGNKIFRKTLVSVQFAISIFMLVGTAVIYDQMSYVQSKNLGFDKDQVLSFRFTSRGDNAKYQVLRSKLLANPNITRVATTSSAPGDGFSKQLMDIENSEGVLEQKGIDNYAVDYDFFPTLGIEFVAGRNFSREYSADTTSAVIVNEAMVVRMNWDDAIGKKVRLSAGDSSPLFHVIGVVKDFHQTSLYNPISPLLFIPQVDNRVVLVKLEGDVKNGIENVTSAWSEVFPALPLEHQFLDDSFIEQYETDQLRGKLFLGFSIMTILISCLGLLGLASFTAEQRGKEISIRKVLGASTGSLIGLLVKDFVILIFFGALPAFVLAYYFMNEWLQTFEYHVTMNALLFIGVLLVITFVTMATTSYHAYMAATGNPAERLKYE